MNYLGITTFLPTLVIFSLYPSKAHWIPPIPLFIPHPSINKSLNRFICTLKYHPNDYEPNQINTTLTFFFSSLALPILFNQPKTWQSDVKWNDMMITPLLPKILQSHLFIITIFSTCIFYFLAPPHHTISPAWFFAIPTQCDPLNNAIMMTATNVQRWIHELHPITHINNHILMVLPFSVISWCFPLASPHHNVLSSIASASCIANQSQHILVMVGYSY